MYGYGTERDEISVFVRQLLLRSSAASRASSSPATVLGPPDQLEGNVVTGELGAHALSTDSSEGNEVNVVDNEVRQKPTAAPFPPPPLHPPPPPPRTSSKRSRAAEVHNLSEKRRRSRINEKMKALQNLIPNSNKTDKASMLDEAIEYLKQLQLQVQMLSMRNGISLHSMCLPGAIQPPQLSHARPGRGKEKQPRNFSFIGAVSVSPDSAEHTTFILPEQFPFSKQPSVPDPPNILDSETFCGPKASIRAHLGPVMLHKSSGASSVLAPSAYDDGDQEKLAAVHPCSSSDGCKEDALPLDGLCGNHLESNASELGIEAVVAGSLPPKAGSSNLEGIGSQATFSTEGPDRLASEEHERQFYSCLRLSSADN